MKTFRNNIIPASNFPAKKRCDAVIHMPNVLYISRMLREVTAASMPRLRSIGFKPAATP